MKEQEELHINLGVLWVSLREHLPWILLVAVLSSIISGLLALLMVTPQYRSVTKLYVSGWQQNAEDVTYNNLAVGSQLAKDYMELVKSRTTIESVIAEYDLDLSYEGLVQKVEVTAPADTRLLEIAVTDENPMRARVVAGALQQAVSRQILRVMDVHEVNVAEPPNLPERPISPNLRKWMVMAGFIGGALAFLGTVVYLLLDDKIKSSEDVRQYLDISLLGLIPVKNQEEAEKGKKKYDQSRRKTPDRSGLSVKRGV